MLTQQTQPEQRATANVTRSTLNASLHLLRCALWQEKPDKSLFSLDTDWQGILLWARCHTVQALVAQQMKRVADALGCEAEMKMCTREMFAVTQRNRHVNQTVATLVQTLRRGGFSAVLLKGQGVARYYLEPLLRVSGDIDLYLGPEHADDAVACLSEHLGIAAHPGRNDRKHVNMTFGDVEIEVHRKATEAQVMARAQQIQEWTMRQLHTDTRRADIGGTVIAVPSALFDVLFVFQHLYQHLLGEGVGLRHVCDWLRCLYVNRDAIDHDELQRLLTQFGMLHAWQLFGLMAVRHLGMPRDAMPLYRERYSRRADRLMRLLMAGSNFGKVQQQYDREHRPRRPWVAKLYSKCRYVKAHWPLVMLFPRQAVPLMAERVKKNIWSPLSGLPEGRE